MGPIAVVVTQRDWQRGTERFEGATMVSLSVEFILVVVVFELTSREFRSRSFPQILALLGGSVMPRLCDDPSLFIFDDSVVLGSNIILALKSK